MPDPAPSMPALNELPYLDEYLEHVLRPRVERVLLSAQRSITESLWRSVIKSLAAEQPSASEATPGILRHLLEERLGLQIQVSLTHTFEKGPEPGVARPAAALEVVITARENAEAGALGGAAARP